MLTEKFRSRSKTHKRKNSNSVEKAKDSQLLIKMLDERAKSSKKIVISQLELNDLKDSKKLLKTLKEEFEKEKKAWISEQASLKSSKSLLVQENQELRTRVKDLEKRLERQEPEEGLGQIKRKLENLEKIVAKRAENGRKLLLHIHKLLAKHARVLLDQSLACSSKVKLTDGIKKISEAASELEKLLIGQDLIEDQPDETEVYKQALEKMKAQTLVLKEKLKELDNTEELKRIIDEQELKIEILLKEKERLEEYIFRIQENFNRKGSSSRRSGCLSAQASPEKENRYLSYIDHDEKDLQIEIANLDNEIQQLQSSLKRALVHN